MSAEISTLPDDTCCKQADAARHDGNVAILIFYVNAIQETLNIFRETFPFNVDTKERHVPLCRVITPQQTLNLIASN